jgi:hypothetical protein
MIASLLIDDARITIPNGRVLTTRRPPSSGALSRRSEKRGACRG